MPGLSLHSGKEAASVSLVTPSHSQSVQYHLLQLNPDMVPLFEAASQEGLMKRTKRQREDDGQVQDDDYDQESTSRICIKGRHSDEAYLCTATETFALREMTQSNSLLLCSLKDSDETSCTARIRSNVAEIWELTPVVARTGRIAQLLQDSMYFGEEEETTTLNDTSAGDNDGGKRKRYTRQQIASIVQASAKELQQGMEESHVIVLDGYCRMIAPSYLLQILQTLLNHLDLCDRSYDLVSISETMSTMQENHGIRIEVIEAVLLTWFGRVRREYYVEIRTDAITRFIGLYVLEKRAKTRKDHLVDFMKEWKLTVGPNLVDGIDIQMLKGHFLLFPPPPSIPTDSNPAMIQHFDTSDLPLDPSIRLQQLFQIRQQWILDDLSAFLEEIAIDSKKRDSILLKYARCTTVKVPLIESKADRKARLKKGITQCPTKNVQMYSARLRSN